MANLNFEASSGRIGPYRLLRLLAQGGLGQVHLGESPDGRLVAIRVVRSAVADDPEGRSVLAREARAAAQVDSPFSARFIDVDTDGPVPSLASEYIPGPTLTQRVSTAGPLSAPPLVALAALERGRARELADALARDRSDLTQLAEADPAAYEEYRAAAEQVAAAEMAERMAASGLGRHDPLQPAQSLAAEQARLDVLDAARQGADRLERAVRQVRRLEGFENFLASPGIEVVERAVADLQPIVYLLPARNGTEMLAACGGGAGRLQVEAWTLPKFTAANVAALALGTAAQDDPDRRLPGYNVWTRSLDTKAKQPVMVWIHGGGYLGGGGCEDGTDGSHLATQGIAVVSFNYRLGTFGYLAHSELGSNFGLQDQIAVLKWVRENIEQFGGDPECVTIFGQSAGGHALRMLLIASALEWAKRPLLGNRKGKGLRDGMGNSSFCDLVHGYMGRLQRLVLGTRQVHESRQIEGQMAADRASRIGALLWADRLVRLPVHGSRALSSQAAAACWAQASEGRLFQR